jgi:hypothetical protein
MPTIPGCLQLLRGETVLVGGEGGRGMGKQPMVEECQVADLHGFEVVAAGAHQHRKLPTCKKKIKNKK